MAYHKLTKEEAGVIENKGTERPHTGEYDQNFTNGVYLCRRCEAPLYRSEDKFDAHCGWPSFDDEIPGAIKRQPDADGSRTEIICNNCGAHLGHVFIGENHTPKNTRHCVNSISLRFIPKDLPKGSEPYAVFGGGCFWCLEAIFNKLKGVKKVVSGYAGGTTLDPDYQNIGDHAEVIKIIYDPGVVDFTTLLKIFFAFHDPTTLNKQGNDTRHQYRSTILYTTLEQQTEAESYIKKLENDQVFKDKIITKVVPLINFYPAEDYHQDYFAKNPEAGYCQAIINPKIQKLRQEYAKMLK